MFRLLLSYFSCTVSSSSSPQFFGSVFLFCTWCRSSSFVSFFVPVQPFPVFVFHTSSSVLLLGYFFVRAFRECVVFVFGCVGVLVVLPWSPSPASGLGSAIPPCSVFLAVLRCPVVNLSSPFLEWFWLWFRFLFLYPSVSFPSDFLLAFCLLPALSSVPSPPGLFGVRLWVCESSSVASLFALPLWFRLRRVTLLSRVVFLPALLPLPPMCAVFLVFFQPVGVLLSSAGLPGAFPSFAPSFHVRSLPSTLYSEIVLHFSFLGVPFLTLIFPLLFWPPLVKPPSCLWSALA